MLGRRPCFLAATALVASLLVAACTEPSATVIAPPTAAAHAAGSATSLGGAPALLACGGDGGADANGLGMIGALGGVVQAGGASMAIPPGAVPHPTLFKVVVPRSEFMEVSITGGDLLHFLFRRSVSITIDYSRCTSPAFDGPLTVYWIDESTKRLLENMGGVDDKVRRRITFTTDHLSGYAIAN